MKRWLAVIVCFFAFAGVANAQDIYVRSRTNMVSNATLARDLPAFQKALDKLHRWWGGERYTVRLGVGSWQITLTDPTSPFDPGGFHSLGPYGPYAIVYTWDSDWPITLSHEAEEMAVDPYLTRTVQGSKLWLVEVADPVENYSFLIQGVPISDFVGPAWYQPGSAGPFDYLHKVKRPEQILPDGYASFWNGFDWAWIENFSVRHG